MVFEYDHKKSQHNKSKHGIDFEEAQGLWDDDNRVEIQAVSEPEERWMITGLIGTASWTAVVTYRGDNIRIISVRRARKEEQGRYEEKNRH